MGLGLVALDFSIQPPAHCPRALVMLSNQIRVGFSRPTPPNLNWRRQRPRHPLANRLPSLNSIRKAHHVNRYEELNHCCTVNPRARHTRRPLPYTSASHSPPGNLPHQCRVSSASPSIAMSSESPPSGSSATTISECPPTPGTVTSSRRIP